jgi:predicted nucleic acid-binding protein
LTALDANVLLYCYDALSPHHLICRAWLTEQLRNKEVIVIPWVSA